MRLPQIIQQLALFSAITIAGASADDGNELKIIPESPLDSEFFDNAIPVSYLAGSKDKTAQNYAIIESGPTERLQKDEVYIEPLHTAYSLESTYQTNNITEANTTPDLYPAAPGIFIDDDETNIPENLVTIESLPAVRKVPNTLAEPDKTGEFVSNEDGGITAPVAPEDQYTVFPDGSFSIGYQMLYLNYSEHNATCETIYNGIRATFDYRFADTLTFRVESNILGGAIFNRNNGSIYSENKFTLGNEFRSGKLTLKPYLGLGLRYLNNIFADTNAISRNTLQLYLPVGLQLTYTPNNDFRFFTTLEAAPVALNQTWTTYHNREEDSTTSNFNGINVLLELGTEYRLNDSLLLNVSPYYQYIYTGGNDNSPIGRTSTHMLGINASIKF